MKKATIDVMPRRVRDRRLLANVPDGPSGRLRPDRRGYRHAIKDEVYSPQYIEKVSSMSFRYQTYYRVKLHCATDKGVQVIHARSRNVSATGILLEVPEKDRYLIAAAQSFQMKFRITPGSLPEGYSLRVNTKATLKRIGQLDSNGILQCAFEFENPLHRYNAHRKERRAAWTMVACLLLLLMGTASLFGGTVRLPYAWPFYAFSALGIVYCLAMYLFSAGYRPVSIDRDMTPGVTIILSCHNAQDLVADAVLSCVNQEYPHNQLEILVVDNASTDESHDAIKGILERLYEEDARFQTRGRVKLLTMQHYQGTGAPLVAGMARAKYELVLFTDAGALLDPFAVRNIVQPFCDGKVAAVCGHVVVANTYTNALTRVQAVYRGLEDQVLRTCQSYFDAVARLAEPLCCCRKELLLGKVSGEDCADGRRLARVLLRRHKIFYQETAYCTWVAPNSLEKYAKREMHEKRSMVLGLGDFFTMWSKEPMLGVMATIWGVLFAGAVPLALYGIWLALHGVFPWGYPLVVALSVCLLAVAQGIVRGSVAWMSGIALRLWYELLLFWQYPVAWITCLMRREGNSHE